MPTFTGAYLLLIKLIISITYVINGTLMPTDAATFYPNIAELTENRHAGNDSDLGVRLTLKLEFLVEDDAFHGF